MYRLFGYLRVIFVNLLLRDLSLFPMRSHAIETAQARASHIWFGFTLWSKQFVSCTADFLLLWDNIFKTFNDYKNYGDN